MTSVLEVEETRTRLVHEVRPTRDHGTGYLAWWLHDLPPMHGLLRFVFYAGLFLLARDYHLSPLRGIEFYEATSPELFRSYGLVRLLGIPYIEPHILHLVIAATSVAWIMAAIGLFSRASAVATAVGAVFLHGMFLGSNAFNHNWFLSSYALIAMCFVRTRDPWSVDCRSQVLPGPTVTRSPTSHSIEGRLGRWASSSRRTCGCVPFSPWAR
jgi:hypothetical protein